MASTVWKGQLTFGMVSFPVRLVRAARKERLQAKYVRASRPSAQDEADPSESDEAELRGQPSDVSSGDPGSELVSGAIVPVRQGYFAEGQQVPSAPAELQRAYEVGPEQFVVVHPDELRALRKATSPDMQVLRSVKLNEIDPVFLETSYYILPAQGGDRPYALFYRALSETQLATLAQVTMHGRDHVIVARAGAKGLIAHTMYYVNEVRMAEEHATDAGSVVPKELDMAKKYVQALEEPFRPEEFTDSYREQLQALIASKEAVQSATATAAGPTSRGKVVDIMDALRKSLETAKTKQATRKPARSEAAAERKPRKRKA